MDVVFFKIIKKMAFWPKQILVHFDFERILQIFMLVAGAVHVMDNIMDTVMDNAMLWTYYGHTVGYYRILWTCYGWFDCYCD